MLVIIGLLVGGIFIGREMVAQAQIKATVSQIQQINTNVNAFKLKYNCLPGDCANATNFFAGSAQPERVQNGNGSGWIAGVSYGADQLPAAGCNTAYYNSGMNANTTSGWINPTVCGGVYPAEWLNAWDHLAAANMSIDGLSQFDETTGQVRQGVQYPKMKFNSPGQWSPGSSYTLDHGATALGGLAFGFVYSLNPDPNYYTPFMASGHKIVLGMCEDPLVSGGNYQWCALTPWDAVQIDTKIDDGRPYSGKMVNLGGFHPYRTTWSASGDDSSNNTETRGCGFRLGIAALPTIPLNTYHNPATGNIVLLSFERGCTLYLQADF